MGAEKYSIEKKITMIKISYSLLRMNIGNMGVNSLRLLKQKKQFQTYLIIENTLAYQ